MIAIPRTITEEVRVEITDVRGGSRSDDRKQNC